jgi:uncharacterized protein (DUF362 family)
MRLTRRDLLKKGSLFCLTSLLGSSKILQAAVEREKEFEIIPVPYVPNNIYFSDQKPVVSIVKINEKMGDVKGIEYAVTKALDLIGGLSHVTKGKERILLKPNLVSAESSDTTNPMVIETLARLMKKAGKNVCIAEASAASLRNIDMNVQGYVCRTRNYKTLLGIQDDVFNQLGYIDISKKLDVPLVNLHVGKMAKMAIPDNFVFKEIYMHEDQYKADLVCSVPMMKTHGLAGVTLALKNVGIGGYPGLVYGTVRSEVHTRATAVEPSGTSTPIVDMVKATKIGLNVIDASTAMEGQGPSLRQGGQLVKMNLIIASTNPLAADMVAVNVMGFDSNEIDVFKWAIKAGMKPAKLDDIQIVGEKPAAVRKEFKKPVVFPYTFMQNWYGPPCKNVI